MEIKNAIQAIQVSRANNSKIAQIQNAWADLDEKHYYNEACALFYPSSNHLDIFTCPDDRVRAILGQRESTAVSHIDNPSDLTDYTIKSYSTIEKDY